MDGARFTPKTITPLRTAEDPNEFNYLGPNVVDKDNLTSSSAASTQDDSTVTKSVHSSFNSRTGLLESGNRANARAYPMKPPQAAPSASYGGSLAGKPFADENAGPLRKQRRVKDPYAIDSESEEEIEDLKPVSKKPQQKEESLADFLKNCPPPPGVDETPQLLSVNAPPPRAKSSGSGKMSTRSAALAMKSRLMRNTSVDRAPSQKLSKTSLRSSKSANGAAPDTSSAPSLPMPRFTATGSQADSYPAAKSDYSAHVEQQRGGNAAASNRHPEEDAIMGRIRNETETGALADFLKNTAPPAPAGPQLSTSPQERDRDVSGTNSFTRMFVRRKKVGV